MATNLLFANAGIPTVLTASASAGLPVDLTYPLTNLFGGNRTDISRLASAASGDSRILIDLGATATGAANFLYLARANLLQFGTVGTVTLKGSNTNSYATATTVHTVSSFTSATLYGPDNEDYLATFAASTAYRYWWLNYNATSATKFPHAKAFFGQYLDVGNDPKGPATITRSRPTGGRRKALYTFTLQYKAMPYAAMIALYSTFYLKRRYNPMVLFTTSYHDILMGHRLVFCRMTGMTMPPRVTGFYDCDLTFEELL